MLPQTTLFCVDPNLGRTDYSSFSDQSLMEMLLDGFDEGTKQRYQDDEEMYIDVCEWSIVECANHERVVKIKEECGLIGSLHLCYIPSKVEELHLSWMKFEGTIDLTQVPGSMRKLTLHKNGITGSADLRNLPEFMEELYLFDNQLTGSIHLTNLPQHMKKLHVDNNKLDGSIDLTKLPASMEALYLQRNNFTGSIDLSNLPRGLLILYLEANQLCGSVDLSKLSVSILEITLHRNGFTGSFVATNLPPDLEIINGSYNTFSEIAVVDSKTDADIYLKESGVLSIVDENGNANINEVSLGNGTTSNEIRDGNQMGYFYDCGIM